MSKRDLIRKLVELGDNYEDDLDIDYSQPKLRKMREQKDKFGGKHRREKPEWKRYDIKDDD